MILDVDIVVGRGDFVLSAAARVGAGETLALVGPSGAGKSTLVEVVAGVQSADAGTVVVAGETLDAPEQGVFVAPERRRIGWVPQGGGLFPHLDAAGNVAFGLHGRGAGKREASAQAASWLARVGLAGRERARVGELSGGEARRVALARALAVDPQVLVLDEPFAGLDPAARTALRRVVREALAETGGARVVVTHEPLDALSLADRVVVLEGGRVAQEGTPDELCRDPRSRYVAELVGVNLLRGDVATEGGHAVLRTASGDLHVVTDVRGPAFAVVRPSAVALYRQPPGGSPRNVIEATVGEVAPGGDRVRVRLEGRPALVAELTAEAAEGLGLRAGEAVYAAVKATEIEVSAA